jgi:hypothetical protein
MPRDVASSQFLPFSPLLYQPNPCGNTMCQPGKIMHVSLPLKLGSVLSLSAKDLTEKSKRREKRKKKISQQV